MKMDYEILTMGIILYTLFLIGLIGGMLMIKYILT